MASDKIMNYENILEKLNMNQLTEICRKFYLSGYSKLKKAELVNFIKESIFEKELFEKIMISMQSKELEYLRTADAIQNNIGDLNLMEQAKYSFAFIDTKTSKAYIAKDIQNFCNEIFDEEYEKKYNFTRSVITYSRALTELWGIVPLEKLVEVYNKQNMEKITAKDVKEATVCSRFADDCYYFYDEKHEELVHESLIVYEGDDAEKLRNNQKDKPYYIPDKMQLIQYSDADYFDKGELFGDMVDFILKNFNCDYGVAYTLTDEINLMARMNCSFEDIMYYIDAMGIEMKDGSTSEKLMQKYYYVYVNSRLWENRGYTTEELKKIKGNGNLVVNHKKVGRNDPCPCGSGKKYKKCCGR